MDIQTLNRDKLPIDQQLKDKLPSVYNQLPDDDEVHFGSKQFVDCIVRLCYERIKEDDFTQEKRAGAEEIFAKLIFAKLVDRRESQG